MDLKEAMTGAIAKEIDMQKNYLAGETINTIYFGGGTPSLLKKEELTIILDAIRSTQNVSRDAEITLEANPDDLDRKKLDDLKSIGVNRLSIGVQSFRDDILRFFNRAHNSQESVNSIRAAREAGFNNISIDLIYGVPGPSSARVSPGALEVAQAGYGKAMQNDDAWRAGIEEALSFRPEHISAYSLTIEDRTVFGKWKASNKLTPMSDELVAEQFEMLMDMLIEKGYDHYEISNFGLPGSHSQHNSNYWNRVKYLGVGPSAHSYDGASRQFNISNNAIYIKKMESGEIPFEKEILTREDKINEYFFIGLRTSAGCDLEYLKTEYDFRPSVEQLRYIEQLVVLEKASFDGRMLKLTNKGKLLADKIASDLFVSAE